MFKRQAGIPTVCNFFSWNCSFNWQKKRASLLWKETACPGRWTCPPNRSRIHEELGWDGAGQVPQKWLDLLRTVRCWDPTVLFSTWATDTILRPMSTVPKYSLLNDMLWEQWQFIVLDRGLEKGTPRNSPPCVTNFKRFSF